MKAKSISSDPDDIQIPFPPMTGVGDRFVDKPEPPEFILVSDINSLVLSSTRNFVEIMKNADMVRKAGGACTVFKATKY